MYTIVQVEGGQFRQSKQGGFLMCREALSASVALLVLCHCQARAEDGLGQGWFAIPGGAGDARARSLLELKRRGEDRGSGAGVQNALAVQTGYIDEDSFFGAPANLITLFWENNGLNPEGILVFANDIPIVDPITLFPIILAGSETFVEVFTNDATLAGATRWDVVSGQSIATDDLVILNSQPFDDPNHSCTGGEALPGRSECDLVIDIDCPRQPGFYIASIDNVEQPDRIAGSATEHRVPGSIQGEHCVTLLAASDSGGNDYLGDPVESCCTMACTDGPCDGPGLLDGCQTSFGSGSENDVKVTWVLAEADYTKLEPKLDGNALPELPGDQTSLVLEDLALGSHVLELTGSCGERGASRTAVLPFVLRPEPPTVEHPTNLTCRFTSPSGSTMVLAWVLPVTHPRSIDVFLIDLDGVSRLVETLPGLTTGVLIEGATKRDRAGLKLNYETGGSCAGTDLSICTPEPPPPHLFLIADCDGSGRLDLTDAIFGLNRLFQSGSNSPCEAACDANLDGSFDISDAVFTLNHLFLGGNAPGREYPGCSPTTIDQECTRTTCR